MPGIESDINQLLDHLKSLLEQITDLRCQVEESEKELAYVQREYERVMGPLNTEADDLQTRRTYIRNILAEHPQPPSPIPTMSQPDTPPPPEPIDPAGGSHLPPPQPPPPGPGDQKDNSGSSKRKQKLADHIDYFVAREERETVMKVINAVLAADHLDVGDMLELLNWGGIWTARPAWETPEEQFIRLQSWEKTLKERLVYWKTRYQNIEEDPRRGLLKEMKSRNPLEWDAYLKELAREQIEYNKKLSQEIDFLETQLEKQQKNKRAK